MESKTNFPNLLSQGVKELKESIEKRRTDSELFSAFWFCLFTCLAFTWLFGSFALQFVIAFNLVNYVNALSFSVLLVMHINLIVIIFKMF